MDGRATSLVCWLCRYLECGPVYWIAFLTKFIVVAVDPESVKVPKKGNGRRRERMGRRRERVGRWRERAGGAWG